MPSGCEVPLVNGQACGIPPIGRCGQCGRAFCLTHQARDGSRDYVDMCGPCLVRSRVPDKDEVQAFEWVKGGRAAEELRSAGVRPEEVHDLDIRSEEVRRGMFHRQWARVERPMPVSVEGITCSRGWILGKMPWTYQPIIDSKEGTGPTVHDAYTLTALLDIVLLERQRSDLNTHWPLVRVVADARNGGYVSLEAGREAPLDVVEYAFQPDHEIHCTTPGRTVGTFWGKWRVAAKQVGILLGGSDAA